MVVVEDESVFTYDVKITAVWAVKGSKPIVFSTGSKRKTVVFGTYAEDGSHLFRQYPNGDSDCFLEIQTYNILEITKKALEVIRKEYANNNEVYVNISEGMKQMAMGSMYAAYIEKDKVKGIYYINPATGELLRYPFLDFNVKNGKKEVLKSIKELSLDKKNEIPIKEIEKKSGLGTTSVYEYVKELKKDGYIDEQNLITDFGRVVLLKK